MITKLSYNITESSKKWKHWVSKLMFTTCQMCRMNHGRIFPIDEEVEEYVPAHIFCKCVIEPMRTIKSGSVTYSGILGAEVYLKMFGKLPNKYIDKETAKENGWENWKGNLSDVLPGKFIGGDIYQNRERKLPYAPGRVWYEADINYTFGFRSKSRIIYSNDGLIFGTYDHYSTFYEVID